MPIAEDVLTFIVEKARAFDVKEEPEDTDSGSDAPDDPLPMREVLEDDPARDATEEELRGAIDCLNDDEKAELVATVWIGRGTYEPQEWQNALEDAQRERINATSDYLMGIPMLADYIVAGLDALGRPIDA